MKKWIGIIILVLIIGGSVTYWYLTNKDKAQYSAATVTGVIGSEKSNFLKNSEVQKLLKDKYNLTVEFKTQGSIEMVQADTAGLDFVWPSNNIALEIFKTKGVKFKTSTIFNSPIVLYTWTPVCEKLIEQKIVEKKNGVYYVVDMPKLTQLMQNGTKWSDIGLSQIYGNVAVISTDPTKSNSGNMFFALLSAMFNGGTVVDAGAVETVLPKLYAYYQSLGYLEDGSANLFKQFISAGMGDKPLIAGYESQIVEFIIENPQYKDVITSQIVVMYPEPTVWANHPLISLTENGDRLITALQDPEIQQIAWKQHGFRTGLAGVQNNPADLGLTGLPNTIDSVMPLPKPEIMERIIEYLENGQ